MWQVFSGLWVRQAAKLNPESHRSVSILYGVLGAVVGYGNLMDGLSGYGQSSLFCPWWPTGLGAFGAAAALAYGAVLAALVAFNSSKSLEALYAGAMVLGSYTAVSDHSWQYLPFWWEGERFLVSEVSAIPGDVETAARKVVFSLSNMNGLLLPVQWWSVSLLFPALARTVTPYVRREHVIPTTPSTC